MQCMHVATLLTEVNCQPYTGEKMPLYSITFVQKFYALFISAHGCKICPFVMAEIVLPELFKESHQPVSAQFSSVSNLFLASKLSMAID